MMGIEMACFIFLRYAYHPSINTKQRSVESVKDKQPSFKVFKVKKGGGKINKCV